MRGGLTRSGEKSMSSRLGVVGLLAGLALVVLAGGATASRIVYFVGDGVHIRKGPATSYTSVGLGYSQEEACHNYTTSGEAINGNPYWYNHSGAFTPNGYSSAYFMGLRPPDELCFPTLADADGLKPSETQESAQSGGEATSAAESSDGASNLVAPSNRCPDPGEGPLLDVLRFPDAGTTGVATPRAALEDLIGNRDDVSAVPWREGDPDAPVWLATEDTTYVATRLANGRWFASPAEFVRCHKLGAGPKASAETGGAASG